MRKYLVAVFIFIVLFCSVTPVFAHEFDSLGILVRHKQNKVSLIAAPALSLFETKANGEPLMFDVNSDGVITFTEILQFENEIAKRVEQLVVFENEDRVAAKLVSIRLHEKGYENLLKIAATDTTKNSLVKAENQQNEQTTFIQISLKFEWETQPQSINLNYGLLATDEKQVLVRDQNIGESNVLVLTPATNILQVFPMSNQPADAASKSIWVLGIEHVVSGFDHILFILTLVLVCKTAKQLILPLSTFTLTHSLALLLVILGVKINIASWLIEAAIAMTIVIMALFELLGWRPKRLFLVTAVMGIIHGFGLGQALFNSIGEIEGWATALVQVTVGIELTQLAIALLFLVSLMHLAKLIKAKQKIIEVSLSTLVVGVGIFWTIERIIS